MTLVEDLRVADAPPLAAPHVTAAWVVRHLSVLIVIDCVAIWLALIIAAYGRFGAKALGVEFNGVEYGLASALIAFGWLMALAANDAYDPRLLGTGPEEFKRLFRASFLTFGAVAIVSYAANFSLARGFVAAALPIGLVLLCAGRLAARRWLVRRRARGHMQNRVLAVGTQRSIDHLDRQLHREPHAGYSVVGSYVVSDLLRRRDDRLDAEEPELPNLLDAVRASAADAVVVTAVEQVTPERLREFAWQLEGSGVELIVAPSLTDVAGPRIAVRPVGGLPLLYVDEPAFTGMRRLVKHTTDAAAAVIGLVLLSPVLLATALAIRLTSSGPALFRQRRTGIDGQDFRVYKFRTMYSDAESRLAALVSQNEREGLLFKIKDDPRITPLGRFLRRTSIDELPQLLNVVLGQMSLVGPRPLPIVDADFRGHVRRRLLVRPGITGLWQVSGRSELSWEDAVRLDLYYVENWSISLDLVILLRTVTAVFRGRGAY